MPSRILAFVCLLLLLAGAAAAQYAPFNNPHQQFFDNNGHPLAGGRISTYAAGTLNPLQTYSDIAGTPNTNPIVLDSGGFATIYLASASIYKFVVSNSSGIQQWTQDNISAAGGGTISPGSGLPANMLLVDNFPGPDFGVQANAAIAALPTTGGTVLFSCKNYPVSNTTIVITKHNVNLLGCGSGSMLGLSVGATTLNFAPTVPGISVNGGYWAHLQGFALVGSDTSAGVNDGINIVHAGPVHVIDVGIKRFGGRGFVLGDDDDLFYLERLEFDSNWGDGFYVSAPCVDTHLGVGINLSSTSNHGWGYNLQCGNDNTWNSPHASNNSLGGWNVSVSYNNFNMVYIEGGTGSSFVINPGFGYNKVEFKLFGTPDVITDNGPGLTNEIHTSPFAPSYGSVLAQNFLTVTTPPGVSPPVVFSFQSGTFAELPLRNLTGLRLRDFTSNTDIFVARTDPVMEFLAPLLADQYVDVTENTAAPSNPAAGTQRWYADSTTHQFSCKTSSGGSCAPSAGASYPGVTSGGFGILNVANTMNVGSSAPTACGAALGCWAQSMGSTTGAPIPGQNYCRADSVKQREVCSFNGGPELTLTAGPVRGIAYTFGDLATGTILTTFEQGYVTIPFSCTLVGWHIMADAGTATIKVWRVNGGTAMPTSSNSINTSGISLATGTKIDSANMTDFTSVAITALDTLTFNLTAVTVAKQITFQLDCQE